MPGSGSSTSGLSGEGDPGPHLKLCIIKPPLPFGWTPVAPPILEYLAALTRQADPSIEIELYSASATPDVFDTLQCDLAAISLLTPTAVGGYRIADALRARGIKVVVGGMHATALPDEAKLHADAVVIGEAESVWPQVLKDFRAGALQPFYRGERVELTGLPIPLYGILKHGHDFRIVNTARGCPYPCAFCTVSKVFGSKIRMRPIDDVVRDVDAIPGRMYINGDENIWWLGKIDRAIELFTALRGSKKKWMGFGSLAPVLSPGRPPHARRRPEGRDAHGLGGVGVADRGGARVVPRGSQGRRRSRARGQDPEGPRHRRLALLHAGLARRLHRRLPARDRRRRPARRVHAPVARRPVPRHRSSQPVRAVPLQGPGLGVLHGRVRALRPSGPAHDAGRAGARSSTRRPSSSSGSAASGSTCSTCRSPGSLTPTSSPS